MEAKLLPAIICTPLFPPRRYYGQTNCNYPFRLSVTYRPIWIHDDQIMLVFLIKRIICQSLLLTVDYTLYSNLVLD
jgi:hypothetical protein